MQINERIFTLDDREALLLPDMSHATGHDNDEKVWSAEHSWELLVAITQAIDEKQADALTLQADATVPAIAHANIRSQTELLQTVRSKIITFCVDDVIEQSYCDTELD